MCVKRHLSTECYAFGMSTEYCMYENDNFKRFQTFQIYIKYF